VKDQLAGERVGRVAGGFTIGSIAFDLYPQSSFAQ